MSAEDRLRGYLKRATAELLEARERLAVAEREDPIAIVGLACRFPGAVHGPEDLWELLERGSITASAPRRQGWQVGDPAASDGPGSAPSLLGGLLDGAADFDADFFGVSPREAVAMDPQHRLLLEASWEALERGGIAPDSLRGGLTGVYVGLIGGDYGSLLTASGRATSGFINGTAAGFASGRIAYTLGLHGPAVTIDTACSSSLVALHDACLGLRNGDCDLALVGGATVMATPAPLDELGRQGGLAGDGRCKAFAAAADGTAFSEGVAVLVVERLADALRAGHEVLAVVRGTAVNHDGASNGLTAPNRTAQEQVVRRALANARLAPEQIDVVEAFGTGTPLGDPIEAQALLATYGDRRDPDRPLLIGSVKSNIGHTQAASGLAGVIKMVLAMRHGTVPATLGVDELTPHVDWSAGTVVPLTEAAPWPATGEPKRAGVSSFSLSGTNVHAILEEAPQGSPTGGDPAATPTAVPWTVSAKSPEALRAQARRLLAHLDAGTDSSDADLGFSLAAGRATLRHRAVVVGADRQELVTGLKALSEGGIAPNLFQGEAPRTGPAGPVFVLPGVDVRHGPDWRDAGARLLASCPPFAERAHACAAAFAPHLDWSPLSALQDPQQTEGLADQVALFTMAVASAALWESCGVRPAAVVGQGVGEIAARHVAGTLPLVDAAEAVVSQRPLPVLPSNRAAVPFYPSVESAREGGHQVFVECGPASAATAQEQTVIGAARHGGDALGFLAALAELHIAGGRVDWRAVFTGGAVPGPVRRVPLPTYAFQHRSYWPEPPAADAVAANRPVARHDDGLADPEVWRRALPGMPEAEQLERLTGLVRSHIAVVLEYGTDGHAIDPDRPFRELGFDSLTAVELRDRLGAAIGTTLPATLVFDYPSPAELADYLRLRLTEADASDTAREAEADAALERLRAAVTGGFLEEAARERLVAQLRDLVRDWDAPSPGPAIRLETASADELFDLLDEQLGMTNHGE
ncbi:beta-ketoacyl synthase N-terminal-like domain-containing protein [Spirillospora sp. NPDC052269]